MGETIYTYKCVFCGKLGKLVLTQDQAERVQRWENGEGLIQEMLPDLTPVQREILITGICPECQERIFGTDSEPEEEWTEDEFGEDSGN